MKRLIPYILTFFIILLNVLPIAARSVDPKSDSVAIAKMRERMAQIRQQRPTVALVLSGGGAKGAAHV